MQILFFFTCHGRQKMAFEIQTEILLSHLQRGEHISIVVDFSHDIFKAQAWHTPDTSSKYIFKILFDRLIKLIKVNGYTNQVTILPYLLKKEFDTPKQKILTLNSIEDIKSIYYKNQQIGISVASSLISYHRDHDLDINKYKNELLREIKIAEEVLDTVEYYYNEIKPELVYVFNGRMAHNAPVFNYCKANNIDCRTYEFTATPNKYHILENAIPHNIEARTNEMNALWNDSSVSKQQKVEIAESFFENQKQGKGLLTKSFTGLQNKSESTRQIEEDKKIISFFNSSIDEYASVPGWDEYIYLFQNEVDAISSICNRYIDDRSKHFILRIHPNLKSLDNTQTRQLKRLKNLKNLTIYEAESSVYTYNLIQQSDYVIVFGSTVGVEACYYGKPVICLGKAFYENIDVAYIPNDTDELYRWVDNMNLTPKRKENTYIYGYWVLTLGEKFNNMAKGIYSLNYYNIDRKHQLAVSGLKIYSKFLSFEYSKLLKASFWKKFADKEYRSDLINYFKSSLDK